MALLAVAGWIMSLVFVTGWSFCKTDGETNYQHCWPEGSEQCDYAFIGIPITTMLIVGLL